MALARGYITITALNDGKDNMLISLLPSANNIHKASSGALTPDKLSCRTVLSLGSEMEVIGIDTPIKYSCRNLIKNSNTPYTGNSSKYNIAAWHGGNYIVEGKTYTILAELYCDEAFANISNSGIGFWISGMASLLPRFKPTTPTIVSLTFKATQSGYLSAYHYPSGSAGNSFINWVMLVEGDIIPEKWTPAPEDYKIKYNNANYTPGTQFTPTRDSIFNLWLGDNKIGQDVIVPMIVDGANGAQGPKGDVGPTGSQGVPGTSQYFHVKYSANANGNPMVDTPNTYIGTAVTASATAPTSYTSYKWVQFKGSQGPKGDQGIKGETGSNGVSSYLHIKYSDNGTSFTANNGETPGKWIGQYVDNNPTDSSSFSAYTWTKVKGDDGASAYTVVLTKDSQGISCNADGSVKSGELGSTSKTLCAITCLKGPSALSAVATTATPTTGQYKYVATCVGGTVVRKDNTSFYLSAMSADVATVSVAIHVENVQIFTKQVVYTKIKDGVDGSSLNLDEFSQKLGYADYAEAVDKASKGETIIKGGYINAQLIQSLAIVAKHINVEDLVSDKAFMTRLFASEAFIERLTADTIKIKGSMIYDYQEVISTTGSHIVNIGNLKSYNIKIGSTLSYQGTILLPIADDVGISAPIEGTECNIKCIANHGLFIECRPRTAFKSNIDTASGYAPTSIVLLKNQEVRLRFLDGVWHVINRADFMFGEYSGVQRLHAEYSCLFNVNSGYALMPNGLMMQWGYSSISSQTGNIYFAKTFSQVFVVLAATINVQADTAVTSISTTQYNSYFSFKKTYCTPSNSGPATDAFRWIAIGLARYY